MLFGENCVPFLTIFQRQQEIINPSPIALIVLAPNGDIDTTSSKEEHQLETTRRRCLKNARVPLLNFQIANGARESFKRLFRW